MLGWNQNELLLEVFPTQEQSDSIAAYKHPPAADFPQLNKAVEKAAGDSSVDWHQVEEVVMAHQGIPTAIAHR